MSEQFLKSLMINKKCRDDWIRTSGLFVPNEARYRAALHPEKINVFQITINTTFLDLEF